MPKTRPRTADSPPSDPARQERYQYCLYLLAEAERLVDQTAAQWQPVMLATLRSRIMQLEDSLTRATTPRH